MSKPSDTQSTPQAFFDVLNRAFRFDLDVCALPENAKCERFFTPEMNGLAQSWSGKRCWMNPPYSRGQLAIWLDKAVSESRAPFTRVCALVPGDTSTRWYHRHVKHANAILLVPQRLRFNGSKSGAKFGSHVVLFGSPFGARELFFDVDQFCNKFGGFSL
jgi:phage N-6-adenine-methyltransferase